MNPLTPLHPAGKISNWHRVALVIWIVAVGGLLVYSFASGAFESSPKDPWAQLAPQYYSDEASIWLSCIGFVLVGGLGLKFVRSRAEAFSNVQVLILWVGGVLLIGLGIAMIRTRSLPYPLGWLVLQPTILAISSALAGGIVAFLIGTIWIRAKRRT